jgi:hypothetical protein
LIKGQKQKEWGRRGVTLARIVVDLTIRILEEECLKRKRNGKNRASSSTTTVLP